MSHRREETAFAGRVARILERHGCQLLLPYRRRAGLLELRGGHPYGEPRVVKVRVLEEAIAETAQGTVMTAADVAYRLQNPLRSSRAA